MAQQKTNWQKFLKFTASLKLAVFVIIAIAVIAAVGTVVEAKFDATTAQKLVYHSWYNYGVLGLLVVNLVGVMVDRWPWKAKHTSFVLAHIGIIILLVGAWITKYMGIDGTIVFSIGQTNRMVSVGETDLALYTSLDGQKYTAIHNEQVDFFLNSPSPTHIRSLPVPEGDIQIIDYYRYAMRSERVEPSARDGDGPAVRFHLANDKVSLVEWMRMNAGEQQVVKNLGPAQVYFSTKEIDHLTGNAIVLIPAGVDRLKYRIHRAKQPQKVDKGFAKPGDVIETGWMGINLRIVNFYPHAKEVIRFSRVEKPSPLTTEAMLVRFMGEEQWMGLNSILKFFSKSAVYVLSWGNRRIDLGFDMKLENFLVGRYQGTMRAASYQSVVTVDKEKLPYTIAMNEPLKRNGYTFYQASFQQDESGNPVASVLSVNRDPGRAIKYLGCILVIMGSIHLFYFRNRFRHHTSEKSEQGEKNA